MMVVLILLIIFLIFMLYEIIMSLKLHFQYYKNEKGRRIKCNLKNKSIHILEGEEEIILTDMNISNMQIQNASLGKAPSGAYEFIKIITTEGKEIYITSLIINLFFIRDILTYPINIDHPKDRHFCKLQ